jgi:hypothetical protein
MWRLGDWFNYGQSNYGKSKWGDRTPDNLYDQIAGQVGLSAVTLKNAKYVCAALPLSRRRDKLTFSHAQEIVGRVDPKDFDFWINKVVTEGIKVKALREQLRKASASYKPEENDVGVKSFLETTRQYVRDFMAENSKFTPAYRAELLKILAPVLRDLG